MRSRPRLCRPSCRPQACAARRCRRRRRLRAAAQAMPWVMSVRLLPRREGCVARCRRRAAMTRPRRRRRAPLQRRGAAKLRTMSRQSHTRVHLTRAVLEACARRRARSGHSAANCTGHAPHNHGHVNEGVQFARGLAGDDKHRRVVHLLHRGGDGGDAGQLARRVALQERQLANGAARQLRGSKPKRHAVPRTVKPVGSRSTFCGSTKGRLEPCSVRPVHLPSG